MDQQKSYSRHNTKPNKFKSHAKNTSESNLNRVRVKNVSPVRLQKALADIKVGSRRKCEQLIEQGNVKINNKTAKLGDKVSIKDRVKVFNRLVDLKLIQTDTYILLYHKSIGELVSKTDDKFKLGISETKRQLVFENLPKMMGVRWINVGRLDVNTSGLLIFTNNGKLAQFLMHPKFAKKRQYAARIYGKLTDEQIALLQQGIMIDNQLSKFDEIEQVSPTNQTTRNTWFNVKISEGRNRIVRKLWQSQGVAVSRLIRINYAGINLPPYLKEKKYYLLTKAEMQQTLKKINFDINA